MELLCRARGFGEVSVQLALQAAKDALSVP